MTEMQDHAGGGARYGGFWIRLLAYIVDFVVIYIVMFVLALIFGLSLSVDMLENPDPADMAETMWQTGLIELLVWLIFMVGFVASPLQATPGKLLVGVKVTDSMGGRAGIGRALGRELAKMVSALILLIGFIMIGFTDRKRGLHDMMAGTLVSYNR